MRLLEFFEDVDETNLASPYASGGTSLQSPLKTLNKTSNPPPHPKITIYQACEGVIDPEVFRANLSPEDLDHIERGVISVLELRSFAEMMAERFTRQRGEVPEGWTATTCCRHCGEVAIWPGCPNEVLGCPWCHSS